MLSSASHTSSMRIPRLIMISTVLRWTICDACCYPLAGDSGTRRHAALVVFLG